MAEVTGLRRGKSIRKNIESEEHPSIIAASSNSVGSVRRKLVNKKNTQR